MTRSAVKTNISTPLALSGDLSGGSRLALSSRQEQWHGSYPAEAWPGQVIGPCKLFWEKALRAESEMW